MSKELEKLEETDVLLHRIINKMPTNLADSERLISGALKFNEFSTLAGALALWNIAEHRYYQEDGFTSMESYMRERSEKLGINVRAKSSISEYLNIAENYMRHRTELYKAGFDETKDSSKLRFLHTAIELQGEKAAIRNLPKMSYRKYVEWARGNQIEELEEKSSGGLEITDRGFMYGDKVILSRKKVEEIVEHGERPFVIGVKSAVEARLIGKFLKAKREEMEG